ncbi:caspase-1-like [Daktulosphaira vitifoliae]|uniref:caspase-1-like n=1 Tax=Daktulosphaira vitifoliae TaxID=58002 RepID=UPI0021AAF193|nr:caspase-1-like [Daktulosphaira vitifoliae]
MEDSTDGIISSKNKLDKTKGIENISFKYNDIRDFGDNSHKLSMNPQNNWYHKKNKQLNRALIFNHAKFTNEKKRNGTDVDCIKLQVTLANLGFKTKVYHDKTLDQIQKISDKWSSFDFSDYDCIVIVILSHGSNGHIYAKDRIYDPKNVFWDKFSEDRCPSLLGKPKIFFIQACQGILIDQGVELCTQVDGVRCTFPIHLSADFFIAYSSVPGYYSWRNECKGSWFITELCSALETYGFEKDINFILTYVVQRVAIYYESNNMQENLYKNKQTPCITSTLTKLFIFSFENLS